ncbi:bifunctional hydroxymethylpyrimidine kinase/phosphomethylpyrimidine kinase [Kineosporia sp. J2-2]|uniref:Bifunctional hydroxymethylpyrimidine kinase/phosphomethylpyrimidine kinase n=1 Tax=Kineosporia corallincola TaxID=2835133 RepID=A0ABS5TFI1_9ACTN|nr:PfkB family carbohydrate kinase [Kineosporia corallincola]MBT0769845.1 bifunctional hydroxymethylpyrimidine kinase/phosphomethylpyrimidine kinase [Kineosporia corallincola]
MNHVVIVGMRADQAVAAAAFLDGPGVATVDGSGHPVCPADVSADTVANADALLVNLDVPADVVRTALYHARGKVMLDPTPSYGDHPDQIAAWVDVLAPFVHVLVPDPPTVGVLSRTAPGTTVDELFSQARDLAERLRVSVIVPMGASGALMAAQGARPRLVPAPPVRVVDTAGADDCFRGVLAVLLAEKVPLPEAVDTAVRAAAWSATAPGPRGALPTRDQVSSLSTTS